jgi:putative hydroxymethylpyrimidine transporter CytX
MSPLTIQAPPEWGITPVPPEHRQLGFFDFFVLWADLGVGLLVLAAGALLVPGLGLGEALLAIIVGTLIGNLLLALTGVVGSDHSIPTMVSLRAVLGLRGSYLPSFINIVQLVGWGAFEIIIMAQVASTISQAVFGTSAYALWAVLFTAFCTALAIGGPLLVVREWLRRFAVWLVFLTTLGLTIYMLVTYDVGTLLRHSGTGALSFWLAVDLVVAMPVSWLPLVSDYNRFARRTSQAFWGTYLGYFVANVWFYGLGALMVLALQAQDLVAALAALAGALTVAGLPLGWLGLIVILVDETDNAFADIYSTAVSGQNMLPRARQRWLATVVGIVCLLIALTVPLAQYEAFLFLLGSFFVPLFGVLAADYFVLRQRRYVVDELYRPGGAYWYSTGINLWAVAAWLIGVLAYQLIAPSLPLPGVLETIHESIAGAVPWLGATIPSFVLSLVLYIILAQIGVREVQVRHEVAR